MINPSVCLCVCLSVCPRAYLWNRWTDPHEILYAPVAVARSSSGGVALRYVLPVIWMTSHLAVMDVTPKCEGCTVHEWRGDTEAESDVYECLFLNAVYMITLD